MEVVDFTNVLPRHPTKTYRKRGGHRPWYVIVHCTDRDWTIEQLNQYDVNGYLMLSDGTVEYNHISAAGLPGITYHGVIMRSGRPYHTLPYDEISWHAAGYNSVSIAVALMLRVTDPVTNRDTYGPSDNQLKSLQCYLGNICIKFGLTPDKVLGHRELEGTGYKIDSEGKKKLQKTCPGMQINLDLLRTNIAIYMQVTLKSKDLYTGKIDGLFGNKSLEALQMFEERKVNNEL